LKFNNIMKLKKLKFQISAVLIVMVLSYSVKAQFRDAVIPGINAGLTPVAVVNNGNDILDHNNSTYHVTVWDDANGINAGFHWKYGSLSGVTMIGAGMQVIDPDICLVKSNTGAIYAVVVFFDNIQSSFIMQSFQWNASQQQFTLISSYMLAPGNYNSAINIASNDNGEFAIVWDDAGGVIRMAIGRAQVTVPSVVQIGQSLFVDLPNGSQPDVCLYRQASNNYRQVNVVFKHPGGYLEVSFYRWNDLLAGIINPVPYFRSEMPDLEYQNPRIACPGSVGGNNADFTVVTEDTDGNSTWYIKVFNNNMCCTPNFGSYIYNNGSTSNSPYNTTDIPNTKPVVAYDNQYNMIWVGWNMDNSYGLLSAPGASFGSFPVAMAAGKRGRLEPQARYLYVPSGITFGSNTGLLSVSGTRSGTALFSWFDAGSSEMYYKTYTHTVNAQQLRQSGQSFGDWLNENINSGEINITVYDITGKLVLSVSSYPSDIHENLTTKLLTMPRGMYAVIANGKNVSGQFTGKLLAGN